MSKIIGQDKLIKEVNRIFQVFVNSNCKIRPHFILTGESGSGWEVYCYRPGLNRGGKRGMLRDCL